MLIPIEGLVAGHAALLPGLGLLIASLIEHFCHFQLTPHISQ